MKFFSHCWLRAGESRFALILIMPPDLVYVHVHKARVSRRFYFVLIFESISSATSNSCLDQESRIVLENNFFIRKMMEAFLLSSLVRVSYYWLRVRRSVETQFHGRVCTIRHFSLVTLKQCIW